MQKEEQSSRQIVMCHLMAIMGINIEKATQLIAEMEESWLIQFDELGNVGLIGFLAFTEVCGIYLFFTERYLYVEDLATNGILSFATFYIIFNLLLVFGLVRKVVRSRIT